MKTIPHILPQLISDMEKRKKSPIFKQGSRVNTPWGPAAIESFWWSEDSGQFRYGVIFPIKIDGLEANGNTSVFHESELSGLKNNVDNQNEQSNRGFMKQFRIYHNCASRPNGVGYDEYWTITDGSRSFNVYDSEDANWLLNVLREAK